MSIKTPLLQACNVFKAWNANAFIEDISLDLYAGDFLALIGANGSGKSTLLRILAGICKADSGHVFLHSKKLRKWKSRLLARHLIYTQQTPPRPTGLSVMDMVLQGRYPWLSAFGFFSSRDYAIASQAIDQCELSSLSSQKAQNLSGGEWQRALLARAICQSTGTEKPVLMLDEIAVALDPGRAISMFSLLEKLRSKGCAILASVHDCNLAAMFATHIFALDKGKILFSGKTSDAFTKDNMSALYKMEVEIFTHPDLGCPQMLPRFKNHHVDIHPWNAQSFSSVQPFR